MKYLKILPLLIFGILCGCHPSIHVSPDDSVVYEVKKMIDNNLVSMKYVKIFKFSYTIKGPLYILTSGKCPIFIGNFMPPAKVIPYKDRYICYINPYNNDWLSQKELKLQLGKDSVDVPYWETLSTLDVESDTTFLIGIPQDGHPATIVRADTDNPYIINTCLRPYIYPAFNSYFWEKHPSNLPKIIFAEYDIFVDSSFEPRSNLKEHIEYLCGISAYFVEGVQSYYADNDSGKSSYFVTVNGKDSLKYEYPDTVQNHLLFNSESCPDFFRKLPEKDFGKYLDRLVRDSTFYVRQRDGKTEYIPVAYFTSYMGHTVSKVGDPFFMNLGSNDWVKDIGSFMKWQNEL